MNKAILVFLALLAPLAAAQDGAVKVAGEELAALLKRWRDVAEPGLVRWAEVFSQALSLNATPLSIADIFRKQMEGHPRAWIFTSATLAVESDFTHYCGELGLDNAENPAGTGCWGSPFDYPNQALLYAPQAMPDPNSREYNEAVVDATWPLIHASRGRAFVLCTSLRAMRRIHELLEVRIGDARLDLPLLLHGEVTDADVDVFDREQVFLDRHLAPLLRTLVIAVVKSGWFHSTPS